MNEKPPKDSTYHAEILPLLKKMVNMSKKHNMPVLVSVEYAKGEFWTTTFLPEGCSETLLEAAGVLLDGVDIWEETTL